MGYEVSSKVYNLTFTDYPGMEVVALGCSLEEMDLVSGMDINIIKTDKAKRLEIFEFFASKIKSWNLEENGVPLPPTSEGLLRLDASLVVAIVVGWALAVARVSLPKELNSNNGGQTGPSNPLPDGLTEEITQRLAQLQSPMKLPEPNFT